MSTFGTRRQRTVVAGAEHLQQLTQQAQATQTSVLRLGMQMR